MLEITQSCQHLNTEWLLLSLLIHSATPLSRTVVITLFTRGFCPYVSLYFSKSCMAGLWNVGLAEGIMDVTCLVFLIKNFRFAHFQSAILNILLVLDWQSFSSFKFENLLTKNYAEKIKHHRRMPWLRWNLLNIS